MTKTKAKVGKREETQDSKEIKLTEKQFDLIKEITQDKVRLQEKFQEVIKQEKDLLSLILDFNGVDETVKITGLTEDGKLKYYE